MNCDIRLYDIRTQLDSALRKGKTPKEFAHDAGISVSWAYRLAWDLGFKSIYVSTYERNLLEKLRKEGY